MKGRLFHPLLVALLALLALEHTGGSMLRPHRAMRCCDAPMVFAIAPAMRRGMPRLRSACVHRLDAAPQTPRSLDTGTEKPPGVVGGL